MPGPPTCTPKNLACLEAGKEPLSLIWPMFTPQISVPEERGERQIHQLLCLWRTPWHSNPESQRLRCDWGRNDLTRPATAAGLFWALHWGEDKGTIAYQRDTHSNKVRPTWSVYSFCLNHNWEKWGRKRHGLPRTHYWKSSATRIVLGIFLVCWPTVFLNNVTRQWVWECLRYHLHLVLIQAGPFRAHEYLLKMQIPGPSSESLISKVWHLGSSWTFLTLRLEGFCGYTTHCLHLTIFQMKATKKTYRIGQNCIDGSCHACPTWSG